MTKNALEGDFGPASKGLEKVIQEIQLSRKSFKMDKRLTGSSIIDEPLQEVRKMSTIKLYNTEITKGKLVTVKR